MVNICIIYHNNSCIIVARYAMTINTMHRMKHHSMLVIVVVHYT
ncbi:hypothetical protein [Candidatus Chromulinivorax destructor]|nr:hypothetical protein [Candidatus Chromulinivorax destructor]